VLPAPTFWLGGCGVCVLPKGVVLAPKPVSPALRVQQGPQIFFLALSLPSMMTSLPSPFDRVDGRASLLDNRLEEKSDE